jgi:hypothetical protein
MASETNLTIEAMLGAATDQQQGSMTIRNYIHDHMSMFSQ